MSETRLHAVNQQEEGHLWKLCSACGPSPGTAWLRKGGQADFSPAIRGPFSFVEVFYMPRTLHVLAGGHDVKRATEGKPKGGPAMAHLCHPPPF